MNKSNDKKRVLVIDDEEMYYQTVQRLLPQNRFEVAWAETPSVAMKQMSHRQADLVILDLQLSKLGDHQSGMQLLKDIHKSWPTIQIIVFTSVYIERTDLAVECVKEGAYYFFNKKQFGSDPQRFQQLVTEALSYHPPHDPLEDNYPHPLALLYRDYRRNVVVPQLKFIRLIELVELTLKFSVVLCLAALRNENAPIPESAAALARPSLGHWFELLQHTLSISLNSQWIVHLRGIFIGNRRNDIEKLVQVRNEWIGHGVSRPDQEYIRMVEKWDGPVMDLLNSAHMFSVWRLFKVKTTQLLGDGTYRHQVLNIKGPNARFLSEEVTLTENCQAGKTYILDDEAGSLLGLYPWLSVMLCDQCDQEAVFIYDKIDRDRVVFLDYSSGHRSITAEPYRAVMRAIDGFSTSVT